MATTKQVEYIRSHLFVDQKNIQALSVSEASKTIDAIRHVYNSLPPQDRHTGLSRISEQVKNKTSVRVCPTCHKLKEPINSTETCSC